MKFFSPAGCLLITLLFSASCSVSQNIPVKNETVQISGIIDTGSIDSLWCKEFKSADEIIGTFTCIESSISKEQARLHTWNMCHYIWNCGEYMFRCRGKNPDITTLPEMLQEIDFNDTNVKDFMEGRKMEKFTDHYFTLKAMKRGYNFDESRDGLTATVFFPIRRINANDYSKLKEVFTTGNDALHLVYLNKMKFPIANSGCSKEMLEIKPLIEKNVADSKTKEDVLKLMNAYADIMGGKKAPCPALKDIDGKEHTFAEFRGKTLVIDVWATWCSSCIKGMPKLLALHEKYKDDPRVEIITVSIDRTGDEKKWREAIVTHGLQGIINLIPGKEDMSQFEVDYHISGIPRYIVIDKDGNIVDAFAPPVAGGLEEIIEKTL